MVLTDEERDTLQRWARRAKSSQALAQRCRIVLGCAAGKSNTEVAAEVGCVAADGMQVGGNGFCEGSARRADRRTAPGCSAHDRRRTDRGRCWWRPCSANPTMPRTGRGRRWPPRVDCRSRRWAGFGRRSGSNRIWSTRSRSATTLTSSIRSATLSGCIVDPPEKALVLCVDEKSQIQALDRSAPVLPMMPGITARRTHDYVRHGITTLFAALNVATGQSKSSIRPHRAPPHSPVLKGLSQDQVDNGQNPRRAGRAPDLRQLRPPIKHRQYSPMACRTSALPHALHPHLRVLAQPGGTMVRLAHRQAATPRHPHHRAANSEKKRHPRDWINAWNGNPKPFTWTKTADEILERLTAFIYSGIPGARH